MFNLCLWIFDLLRKLSRVQAFVGELIDVDSMSQRLEQIRTEPIKVHDINLSSIFNIQNIEYPPSIILVVTIVMKIKTGVQIYWIPIQCS